MENQHKILLGAHAERGKQYLLGKMANRHGLIAGATGTGKTVSLQILAEGFSKMGVPVFTADVKGDLSGISQPAKPHPKIDERINLIGIEDYQSRKYPTLHWDLYGEKGHPVRTTISEIGPLLLAHILEANDTQEGVLHIAFSLADDQGLLLLDLKDLKALLQWMSEHTDEIKKEYGNVSPNSVAALQRKILVLSESGGDKFFGEPALKIQHLMQKDFSGNGVVSILNATKLINNPRIYSTFLLWLLSEIFEQLPEAGDPEVPKLVFFFDEAHLLFDNAPSHLLEKIEQVVRLIRSKGVGVYFITQHPLDVPDAVLGQLGNRIQHALRAFTPRDQKAVKTAAQTFRANPEVNTEEVITTLGVGEALVSTLDEDGRPSIVEQSLIVPPESRIGPASADELTETIKNSPLSGIYEEYIDRESAYEMLIKREAEKASEPEPVEKAKKSNRQGPLEAFFKSLLRSVGSSIGRKVARGILGSISGR